MSSILSALSGGAGGASGGGSKKNVDKRMPVSDARQILLVCDWC
jgi:hypothetical protein